MGKPLLCLIAVGILSCTGTGKCQTPKISLEPTNCLNDSSGTPGICALSNTKQIDIRIALKAQGSNRLSGLPLNPDEPLPSNYLIVRVVDEQTGTPMPLRINANGTGEENGTTFLYANLQILEAATARQRKLQTFIDQAKAHDLATGAASQQLVDELTAQNAEALEALDNLYVENRLGRFKLSVEYHSSQPDAWKGTVTSPEVIVDVVNKGNWRDLISKTLDGSDK